MRIKEEMGNKYRAWLARRRTEPGGQKMIDALWEIGACLENDRRKSSSGEDALETALGFEELMSLWHVTQLALAISLFHERGDALRFAWNKKYRGEDWAIGMECSDKKLYDPT